MKCILTRLLTSWCSDFDRPLPAACRRHIRNCPECREFLALDGELLTCGVSLAGKDRAFLRPSQEEAEHSTFVHRMAPVSAALAILLLLGLVMGSLPRRNAADAGDADVIAFIEADVASVEAGADVVLGTMAEEVMREEIDAWRAEVTGLLASIPLFPGG